MENFRDYNLIELIKDLRRHMYENNSQEYLQKYSPEVRFEIMVNFWPIISQISLGRIQRLRR